MKRQAIYLSRVGKVDGPFTAGKIEDMRQKGDLYLYDLIWLNSITGWTTLEEEVDNVDVPPPPPPVFQSNVQPTSTLVQDASLIIDIPKEPDPPFIQIDAICFDKKTIVSGKIQNVSTSGCQLKSDVPIRLLPTFRVGSAVSLNLFNSLNGNSENTPATIQDAKQGDEYWEYALKWDLVPSLLNLK
jgi:hypothetical protein